MNDYQKYREQALEQGVLFQDFVVKHWPGWTSETITQYSSRHFQIHEGEGGTGHEIKLDNKRATTGNLWIEFAEKAEPRPGCYATSGIYRKSAVHYVIGDYTVIYQFATNLLRRLHQSRRFPVVENGTLTSRGFLLSEPLARACATRTIDVKTNAVITPTFEEVTETLRREHFSLYRLINPKPEDYVRLLPFPKEVA